MTEGESSPAFSLGMRLAGAAVHLYTASGSVLGLLIVLAAIEGDIEAALWLGLAALWIDGTDGMLARRARVKETIPWFDGSLLDNIVDYLTYVFAPVVLLWTTGALSHSWIGWLLTYAVLLLQYPDPHPVVVVLSFAYVVYHLAFSGWLTARAAHRRRRAAR